MKGYGTMIFEGLEEAGNRLRITAPLWLRALLSLLQLIRSRAMSHEDFEYRRRRRAKRMRNAALLCGVVFLALLLVVAFGGLR